MKLTTETAPPEKRYRDEPTRERKFLALCVLISIVGCMLVQLLFTKKQGTPQKIILDTVYTLSQHEKSPVIYQKGVAHRIVYIYVNPIIEHSEIPKP